MRLKKRKKNQLFITIIKMNIIMILKMTKTQTKEHFGIKN